MGRAAGGRAAGGRAAGGRLLLIGLSWLLAAPLAWAAPPDEIATPGGPLVVRQLDDQLLGGEFAVTIAGKTVLHTKEDESDDVFSDYPVPAVIRLVDQPIGSFDAVAVFQQSNWGNACNGGPIWFLGIHRDGSFARSAPIDACGGPVPQVTVDHGVIHVLLPRSDQVTAAEQWVYSGEQPERVR